MSDSNNAYELSSPYENVRNFGEPDPRLSRPAPKQAKTAADSKPKGKIARKLKCLGAVVALISLIFVGAFAVLFIMVAELQSKVHIETPKANYSTSNMNEIEINLYSNLQRIEILTKELEKYHLKISRLNQTQSKLIEVSGFYIASNQRAYKLYKSPKSYHDAKTACESTGAMLASVRIRNSETRSELLQFLKKASLQTLCAGSNACLWIGLSFSRSNNTWMWLDGISNDITINWDREQPGHPDPGHVEEDCAVIYRSNGKVHDYNCNKEFYYLCEK